MSVMPPDRRIGRRCRPGRRASPARSILPTPIISPRARAAIFSAFRPATISCRPSRWLIGVEAAVSFPSFVGGNQTISSALTGTANYLERVEFSGNVLGRVGYAQSGQLAVLRHRRLRLELRPVHPHAESPAFRSAAPRCPARWRTRILKPRAGGAVGAGVEFGIAARTGPHSSNICSPITQPAASLSRPARNDSIPT